MPPMQIFWIPLSDLARDAAYDSKDVQYLKRQLEDMQNIKLLMEDERQWIVTFGFVGDVSDEVQ